MRKPKIGEKYKGYSLLLNYLYEGIVVDIHESKNFKNLVTLAEKYVPNTKIFRLLYPEAEVYRKKFLKIELK